MNHSKNSLQQEANKTGFRPELIEKVFILMELLEDFATFPQLKNKFALKGGTALNLFFFNLPRLSIDIDLNYIGSVDREKMLSDRPFVQSTIISICERNGLTLDRKPNMYAGGKMVMRYQSVLGHIGTIDVDLNFMYRVPLWPIEYRSSCLVGSSQIHNIPLLNIHELCAGKLTALIDRKTGRDLFDAHHILTKIDVDMNLLRLGLVVYSAMNRNIDLRQTSTEDILVNVTDISNRLVPMLKKEEVSGILSLTDWSNELISNCRNAMRLLLPINSQERIFLTNILDKGIIDPNIISTDNDIIENIKRHPAIKWSAQNARKQ